VEAVQALDPASIPALIGEAFTGSRIVPSSAQALEQFSKYLQLIVRWNQRINLTAIREPDQIIQRHFVECAFTASQLPPETKSLLDFGSGAGFPGIPIAICRPDIRVTLAESQGKKAAFLRESVRLLQINAEVYPGRVESMPDYLQFDVVAMRAVEKMRSIVGEAARRARNRLFLLTTRRLLVTCQAMAGEMRWQEPLLLPGADHGILAIGCPVSKAGSCFR
jgi:16S rRNA (guanine527-N7)-methyltransferase